MPPRDKIGSHSLVGGMEQCWGYSEWHFGGVLDLLLEMIRFE